MFVLRFPSTAVEPSNENARGNVFPVRCLQVFTSDLVSRMCSHFPSPCLSSRNEVRDLPYMISGRSLTSFRDDMSECRGGFFAIFAEVTACGVPAGYYPATGYRYRTGEQYGTGTYGHYWSSSGAVVTETGVFMLRFYSTAVAPSIEDTRGYGFTIRCLQAFTLAIFGRTEHGERYLSSGLLFRHPERSRRISGEDEMFRLHFAPLNMTESVFRFPCSLFSASSEAVGPQPSAAEGRKRTRPSAGCYLALI